MTKVDKEKLELVLNRWCIERAKTHCEKRRKGDKLTYPIGNEYFEGDTCLRARYIDMKEYLVKDFLPLANALMEMYGIVLDYIPYPVYRDLGNGEIMFWSFTIKILKDEP